MSDTTTAAYVTGDEARAIDDARRDIDGPSLERMAREALSLPGDWQGVIWKRLGSTKANPQGIGVSLEGGVCPPKARGKYKGAPDWKAATDKAEFVATFDQVEAYELRWERETGKCKSCLGIGMEWSGWNHLTGNRYRTCRRCEGTGKTPEPAQ